MSSNNELGNRMKEYYESIPKTKLMRRTPVAIRIDGKTFHTFTRGFQKPFDKVLIKSIQETMKYLCENIQNCVLGFTESDEITLILVDYKNLNSSAWFDYEVQKMCSIAASMATMAFNKFFAENVKHWASISGREMFEALTLEQRITYEHTLNNAVEKSAMFDARCFNIPKEEVTNLIYWRQLDAIRNSIQMVGQANFSYKELQNKSCNMIQDMLMTEKGINWNDFPTYQKRGSCCIIGEYYIDSTPVRTHWVIDEEIPIFKGEDREYIEKLINF
ncbi:MAG: tRNA(His) guanylyltransferase Thg1 family protein [Lachnospira sp.]|nr:tRNA(His) guanylyltransferase Thg1 family protein [Lachnospira sp.]